MEPAVEALGHTRVGCFCDGTHDFINRFRIVTSLPQPQPQRAGIPQASNIAYDLTAIRTAPTVTSASNSFHGEPAVFASMEVRRGTTNIGPVTTHA